MAKSTDSQADEMRPARWYVPWLLAIPALAWLIVFFVVPMVFLGRESLKHGGFSNFTGVFRDYTAVFRRTFWYALLATLVCVLLGYPLAYYIAMRAKKAKNVLLALVVLPFFTTYLIRTISWLVLLTDRGPVPRLLRSIGLLGDKSSIIGTTPAVVGALAYNFLPFMVLPIYVSLEKVDKRLLEAGPDLYASAWRTFRKVTLPLSLPGLFAGSLLTFIPAAGDFINVEFVGTQNNTMIGNIVSTNFLKPDLRPAMSAIAFVLMVTILVGVFIYARLLGTEELV
jgi:spermidine/putrescine transport system permease protein